MTDHPLTPSCPDCGTRLPADSPQQLCPACLLRQALASRTAADTSLPESTPPPKPEEIANKFPHFEITECLGRGGMGVVYKARQKSLNRWVAIKILAPERVGDPKFAERFAREAQTLAKLNHPNIVTVYDYGETDGLYYIVMEFVDGINLRDLLRDGNLDAKQALTIVPPVCEALQFAHDRGIVHRDIKPENLLLNHDGRIKIADFGIAAMIGTTGESSGTPPYMAPEQDGSETNVDHRADIYALGVVLYEALTGERPGSNLQPPSQKVQLDIRIDDIVLRALSKEPERRYGTADQFRTMVETVASTPDGSPPTPPSSHPPAPAAPQSKPLDPLWKRIAGIALIVVGGLSLLATVASLIMPPMATSVFSSGSRDFLPDLPHRPEFANGQAFVSRLSPLAYLLFWANMLFTIAVAVLSILGGREVLRDCTKPMAIIGSIACCLTPLWWPLGLFIGIFALVVVLKDRSVTSAGTSPQSSGTGPAIPVANDKPRLSGMAVTAATLQFLGIGILIVVALLTLSLANSSVSIAGGGGTNVIPFSALVGIPILLLLMIPGAVLGWVAAARIRASKGTLTGRGFAIFAVMLPLTLLSLAVVLLSIRFGSGIALAGDRGADTATRIISSVVTVFSALVLVGLGLKACVNHLNGSPRGSGRRGLAAMIALLLALWVGLGLLHWLQRPHALDRFTTLNSPDRQFTARVSTQSRMRVFGPDVLTYRIEIQDPGRAVNQIWNHRVPVASLNPNHSDSSNPDYLFEKGGRIDWAPDSKAVSFHFDDQPVFALKRNSYGSGFLSTDLPIEDREADRSGPNEGPAD